MGGIVSRLSEYHVLSDDYGLQLLSCSRIARRDAAKNRHESKRSQETSMFQERAAARREKEKVCECDYPFVSRAQRSLKATMDMFQQLAKQRFG